MPKRWGSAHRDGRIALNPELVRAPSVCIDLSQIQDKLKSEDLLVFYGSLRDVSKSDGQLVYALIGLYVIDTILVSTAIPKGSVARKCAYAEDGDRQ